MARRAAIIFMGILTVGFGILSVIVAAQLQFSQTPQSAYADCYSGCIASCNHGAQFQADPGAWTAGCPSGCTGVCNGTVDRTSGSVEEFGGVDHSSTSNNDGQNTSSFNENGSIKNDPGQVTQNVNNGNVTVVDLGGNPVNLTNPGGTGGGTSSAPVAIVPYTGTGVSCNCGSKGTLKLDPAAGDCTRFCAAAGGSVRGVTCNGAPAGSVTCDGCPDGQGRVCQTAGGGTYSGCVRAHACGFTGNLAGLCVNDGQCDGVTGCAGGTCSCQSGQCTKKATGIAQGQGCGDGTTGPTCGSLGYVGSAVVCQSRPNAPAACVGATNISGSGSNLTFTPTNQIFVGCGNMFGQNSCSNCYQKDGAVTCVREATSCGTKTECYTGAPAPITTSTQIVPAAGGDDVPQTSSNPSPNPTPTPPPPPPSMECGQSCSASSPCRSGFTCDNGTCKMPYCISNPASCDSTGCQPVACGDGATNAGEECGEPGLTCGSGEICMTDSCICLPSICGDDCTSDSQCGNGQSCSNGTCKLDVCINSPSTCSSNGCFHTPITAIISDDTDRIILAVILMVLAGVTLRYRLVDSAIIFIVGTHKANKNKGFENRVMKQQSTNGILILLITVAAVWAGVLL